MTKQIYNIKGFSLFEVLISLFILTFGLVGITGLYIKSFKRTENAYWHTLATTKWIIMSEQQKAKDTIIIDRILA